MSAAKRKGTRVENKVKDLHLAAEVACRRQPDSGAFGTITKTRELQGDLFIQGKYLGEVKARKNGEGFKVLDGWLGDNDFLFLAKNNKEVGVYMRFDRYINLMVSKNGD